jgi:hypothetical protein
VRVRSALLAMLLCVPAVVLAEDGAGRVGADGPVEAGRSRRITVTGVLERLVVDTTTGSDVRYSVRGAEQTWWLEGLAEPAPEPGSVVEVIGVPTDPHTLTVEMLRVADRGGATSLATPALAPSSTRVLVLPLYWAAQPPATPTRATVRRKVITTSRAWFEEVSHGRYSVSGTVTPWLKISPQSYECGDYIYDLRDEGLAAARRAGYHPARFERIIFYVPCSDTRGLAQNPGTYVWLFGHLLKSVVMHEQGHNLGLNHASSRACYGVSEMVTWSSDCSYDEYGSWIDTMGHWTAGHYSAYYKHQLGWLQRFATVRSSQTVTLAPYETTGPGLKAVRVLAGGETFWLEYRTRPGTGRAIPPGTNGVYFNVQEYESTKLLDAAPGSATAPWYDEFQDAHLPVGSSWTGPRNVRFTVIRQTPSAATVAIRFAAGVPKPPDAPAPVRAEPLPHAARITWTRPADNGDVIRRYTITRSTDAATRTVTTPGGLTNEYTWNNLDPQTSYTFSVTADNVAGTSPAVTSAAVHPESDGSSVTITSPADGATVEGVVRITIAIVPHPDGAPIDYVEWAVDQEVLLLDLYAWTFFDWNTQDLPNGPHTIHVKVVDSQGRPNTTSRTLTVNNPTPP